MLYEIRRRWSGRRLCTVDAASMGEAVELAVRNGVSLLYADLKDCSLAGRCLSGADLRSVDLSGVLAERASLEGADLRSARLVGALLHRTNLSRSDLRQADLRSVDLRNGNCANAAFVGADLRGAMFTGAGLAGALLDWRWVAMPLEVLRRADQGEGKGLVEALAFEDDARPFVWLKAMLSHPSSEWALGVLSNWISDGDNAPSLLRRLCADAKVHHDPIIDQGG